MHYEGPIIRPPSEADSILLQVTVGCSHNKCNFCGIYKDKTFRIKDDYQIEKDLLYASIHFREKDTVFLCDGDALIIPFARLQEILLNIRKTLPWVSRVGTYANTKSIARKTTDELVQLRELGLRIIHMGLESGDDETLRRCGKWGDVSMMIKQGQKVREAGINLFITVLLGLAGPQRSSIHAEKTGYALTQINPNYVGALSLIPVENTPLYEQIQRGEFNLMGPLEILKELRIMLQFTDLRPGYFYANHASNYLPLRARLPRDKETALAQIDNALKGRIKLTPEWLRGL
jgi:radical SAM superfamily enzyme YgiQ (UPF0313 family)